MHHFLIFFVFIGIISNFYSLVSEAIPLTPTQQKVDVTLTNPVNSNKYTPVPIFSVLNSPPSILPNLSPSQSTLHPTSSSHPRSSYAFLLKRPSFFSGFRWSIDAFNFTSGSPNEEWLNTHQAVGLDLYTLLQTRKRVWGTLVIQLYGFRSDHFGPFSDQLALPDWGFFPSVVSLDFHILTRGALRLKVGHLSRSSALIHL